MTAAFRALLDLHTPGWASMSMDRFRQALNTVPGRFRPALRIAFEVAQGKGPDAGEAVEPAPVVVATPAAKAPAKPKKKNP